MQDGERFPTSFEHLPLSVLLAVKQYFMSEVKAALYTEVKLARHFSDAWGALVSIALERAAYACFASTLATHMLTMQVAVLQTKEGLGVAEGAGGRLGFCGAEDLGGAEVCEVEDSTLEVRSCAEGEFDDIN